MTPIETICAALNLVDTSSANASLHAVADALAALAAVTAERDAVTAERDAYKHDALALIKINAAAIQALDATEKERDALRARHAAIEAAPTFCWAVEYSGSQGIEMFFNRKAVKLNEYYLAQTQLIARPDKEPT